MMFDEAEAYVRQRSSMVIATRLAGEVRAATVCFALGERLQIYFFVFRDSVKHRGILENPQVALVIDDGFTVPMRGIEIIGTATVVTGAERQRGQTLLRERFPELEEAWEDPRILIVRVTPDRVRFTDWTHGIGQSREADVPQQAPHDNDAQAATGPTDAAD
jgi:general stress protein 26